MARIARLLAIVLAAACIISAGLLAAGAMASRPAPTDRTGPPAADPVAEASVTCLPFGLYGESLAETVVGSLSDSGGDLIFQASSIGLYVLGLDGTMRHFLYTPFGVRFVTLIDDITGDGNGEVVLALGSTQVPALRCYDGATWEKLWQYAPMVKVWDDRLWVQRQTSITSLAVIENEGSPSLAVVSGGEVLAVDARDGTERWRSGATRKASSLEALGDLNGDGNDEVFAAATDGRLFLLDGRTGEARWQTRLPEQRSGADVTQITPGDALVLDAGEGLVAVAATDGLLRLCDLGNKRLEWDIDFSDEDTGSVGPMTLVPHATADDRPGMLVLYCASVPQSGGYWESRPRMALLDTAGNSLWDRDAGAWTISAGTFGGRPVVIMAGEEGIRLLDMADGETLVKTIGASALESTPYNVRQIGADTFLVGSEMTALSSTGDVLWHYPLIDNVRATSGGFVGDATEDTLFSGEWERESWVRGPGVNEDGIALAAPPYTTPVEAPEPEVRLLKVMDGATGEIAWSYEVPPADMKDGGGLKGVRVAADLVGNNAQDVVGYRADSVFVFDGSTGAPASFPTGQPVESLQVMRNGSSGSVFAVVAADNLTVFDSAGAALWTTTGAEWVDGATVRFTVLDDINSDNVSDLAVLCESRIVLLESAGSAAAYQAHLTFDAETGCLIEFAQVVPDANGDGVRELACIQRSQDTTQGDQEWDKTPVLQSQAFLVKRSPVGGEQLLRITIPGWNTAIELSCGDFNGDGCADALMCCDSYQIYGDPSSPGEYGAVLRVISGRDGTTLWEHLATNKSSWGWNGWKSALPAGNVGDVTGDGRDDLGWSSYNSVEAYSGYWCTQQLVEFFDVAHDQPVATVAMRPLLGEDAGGYGVESPLLPADADGDGRAEVLSTVSEPATIPSYMVGNTPYLAVADPESGERLAAFLGFDLTSVSLFETHRPGVLGVAGAGGAYFLDTGVSLRITSPAQGASTGPTVDVRWEGTGEGEFVQVFVDGVRNHTGNGSGIQLYLGRGDHDIVVWSIDDCGRILYGPADLGAPISIRVTPSPWMPVMLVLTLLVTVAFILALLYPRLHRTLRARRRAAMLQAQRP